MVFKRLLGSLGVGAPTIDTVLEPAPVVPGGALGGQVHLKGGQADFDIEHITLDLVARVEAEHAEGESEGTVVFDRFTVGGGFRLAAGESRSVPFGVTLPWETPVTELYGQPLGIVLGVRTEVAVAGAKDQGDLDPLTVTPLPAQEAILEAFGQLGFGFKSADLEYGHIGGTGQLLPFYQEIELHPAPQYAHQVNEVELTFLAGPGGLEVVLEADKRGGLLSSGHDALTRVTVGHHDTRDWTAEVDGWIRRLLENRSTYGASPAYGHAAPYADHEHHGSGEHRHHEEHHRSGPGVGTAIAAGAAGLAVGVVGGMVAAEVVDEVGDFFEGDEDEG
ncbi:MULTISPECIES: sporulation protein [Streptomyces]|uniref:Sporulation protein n=3 Tax=Streptomyces rochei group TaxID=2867164 RepID=A0AAX3ZBG0_STRRO|nr:MULTISPECIES: sporulation protein [Streptomyces]KYK13422.1 sporulation protein [Streptomyces sp. CC71]MBJ6617953.1 sporulation protein [Streptomyces sp. DHE17-7]MBQ0876795.1 sporulation protein [Streptomyces sp. RT42]MBU8547732.1 sporulation protein [Streptomyces sp. Osf17]MBU8554501.1 sporulation protein [Streptomyces sp. Babs14]